MDIDFYILTGDETGSPIYIKDNIDGSPNFFRVETLDRLAVEARKCKTFYSVMLIVDDNIDCEIVEPICKIYQLLVDDKNYVRLGFMTTHTMNIEVVSFLT